MTVGMTYDEMVQWAGIDSPDDERLRKLIWIAQTQSLEQVWRSIAAGAVMQADAYGLSSYPMTRLNKAAEDNGEEL